MYFKHLLSSSYCILFFILDLDPSATLQFLHLTRANFFLIQIRRKSSINSSGRSCGSRNFAMNGDGIIEVIPLSALPDPERRRSGNQWQLSCVPCSPPPPQPPLRHVSTRRRHHRRAPRYNSVSKIDRASRVVFPLFFLAINVFYWWSYLSRSERIS